MNIASRMGLEIDNQRVKMSRCRVQMVVDTGVCEELANSTLFAV